MEEENTPDARELELSTASQAPWWHAPRMPFVLENVFAYLKPNLVRAHRADVLVLDPKVAPLAREFANAMLVMLLHDAGSHFEYLTRGDADALGLTEDALFELGTKNLGKLLDSGSVTASPQGAGLAILAGGNFEASLLLVPDLWHWVSKHLGAPTLLAAVPARDLLMVVNADDSKGRADLDAFLAHTRTVELDHRLSDDVLRWDGARWTKL